MKLNFRICSKWLAGVMISALLPSLGTAADVVLQKAPPLTIRSAPAYPENLAKFHFGADVKAAPRSVPLMLLQLSSNSSDQNTSEAALLCDDPTTGYVLPAGASSLLVSLSNIENVEHLAFLNEGAEGDFEVAVYHNNRWNCGFGFGCLLRSTRLCLLRSGFPPGLGSQCAACYCGSMERDGPTPIRR